MKNVAIITGILLIVIGVAGYGTPQKNVTDPEGKIIESKSSPTALIPAFVGLPIFLCGILAYIGPRSNKFFVHVAALVGLLGALAASVRGSTSLLSWVRASEDFNARSFVFVSLMAIICWMFVVFCFGSFVKARKAREASSGSSQ